MQSEVIFKQSSSWFGRYAEDEGYEITIYSDFSQPWPYLITKKSWSDDDVTTNTEKLSLQSFNAIKQIIANHSELASYPDNMEPKGWSSHEEDSEYFFKCDSFSKSICGSSLFSWCFEDYDNKEDTPFANLYVIAHEVQDVIKNLGSEFQLCAERV